MCQCSRKIHFVTQNSKKENIRWRGLVRVSWPPVLWKDDPTGLGHRGGDLKNGALLPTALIPWPSDKSQVLDLKESPPNQPPYTHMTFTFHFTIIDQLLFSLYTHAVTLSFCCMRPFEEFFPGQRKWLYYKEQNEKIMEFPGIAQIGDTPFIYYSSIFW